MGTTKTLAQMSPGDMAELVAKIDWYRRPDERQQRTRGRLATAISRACPSAAGAQTEMDRARAALITALDDLDAERAGEGHFDTLNRLLDTGRRALAEYRTLRDLWVGLVTEAVA